MKILRPTPLTRCPRVTVVVPHFNYGQFLPVAVESALNQTGIDIELIIVDDRSTDGSVEVARRIAATNDRIQLVEHEQNMRHIRTYNDGLSRATGDYVVLLSADDAVSPNSISRSVALMEANPKVGLVYGRVERFVENLPAFRSSRQWWQVWQGNAWIDRVARRGRNAIASPEAVMRKSVFDAIGGYDPDFPHAGDMYMWLLAATHSDIGFVGGPRQAYYRVHGENMHLSDFGGALDDMNQVRDVYQRFFKEDGAQLQGSAQLYEKSMNAVAREALLRGALLASSSTPSHALADFRSFATEVSPGIRGGAAWSWSSISGYAHPAIPRTIHAIENTRWRARSRRADLIGL